MDSGLEVEGGPSFFEKNRGLCYKISKQRAIEREDNDVQAEVGRVTLPGISWV